MKELVFHRLLLASAERHPDKLAFVDDASSYHGTFSGHTERVFRLSSAMRSELGLRRGDRFAVLDGNSHRFMELWHAGFLGAAIVNPLNIRHTASELAFILSDSGATVCFSDGRFAPLVESIKAETAVRHVVLMGPANGPHDVRYEELLAAGEPVVPAEPEEDEPVALMYTGGTTGLPKGVVLTHRAEMLGQYHAAMRLPSFEDGVHLNLAPMFHGGAMGAILAAPGFGHLSVILPAFEPGAVLEAIEHYRVTGTGMVPTMIAMLLEHPEFRPERLVSLRRLVYGASPASRSVVDRLVEVLPALELIQGYGMTESASVITALTPADHRIGGNLLRSAGRPLPGVVVSIQDDDGNRLPRGELGEVCAKGGNFMLEYWKRPEETAHAFRGGWYRSGDIGYLDEDGYLYLVDRTTDMIITGGENVYPSEVEHAIASHPSVAEVAVIGVPDALWGEAVAAIVVPRDDALVSEQGILDHARQSLAGYKVPRSVFLRSEPLPRSAVMKVLKRELRAAYQEGAGTRIQ